MSIQLIKEQIRRFLADDSPSILAICGKWGVGKTHFWNTTIQEYAKSKETFKLDKYGYTSLFGINSLGTLKSELFTSIVDRNLAGKDITNIETAQENKLKTALSYGKMILGSVGPKAADLVMRNSSSIAESLYFASIRKAVICFDDLERKSKGLELRDVLGLASLLKEQKKCKVVLLLNDDEEGLEDFKKYHEKVVDLKLRFEPTTKECVQIALPGGSEETKKLRESICKLKITNIRTIKKIERVVNIALPLFTDFEPEITDQAISSLVLFSWCHYRSEKKDIPTIEHVTKSGYAWLGLSDEKFADAEKELSEEKLWNDVVQQYGYTHTDEFDLELVKGVVDGYFDEDALVAAASQNNESIIAAKTSGSFRNAWDVSVSVNVVFVSWDNLQKKKQHLGGYPFQPEAAPPTSYTLAHSRSCL
jgi:hypothetical protein